MSRGGRSTGVSEQVLEEQDDDAGCVLCDGTVTAAGTDSEGKRQRCLEHLLCVTISGPFLNISNAANHCPEGSGGSPLHR